MRPGALNPMTPPLPIQISGPFAVVGDTHGQDHLLEPLLQKLFALDDFDKRWLVFVGDFVDRGPNPRRVVEIVLDLIENRPRTTAIMGNHELAMCASLGLIETPAERDWAGSYLAYYSPEPTFESYGVEAGNLPGLHQAMPEEHKDFLASLPWAAHHPENLIVHAGLTCNGPYEAQLEQLEQRDFSLDAPPWLCDHNLASTPVPADCPKTVISGHVPLPEPLIIEKRILIDTSGGMGDTLSAILMPERTVIRHTAVDE